MFADCDVMGAFEDNLIAQILLNGQPTICPKNICLSPPKGQRRENVENKLLHTPLK
jgi:hypothetical protein